MTMARGVVGILGVVLVTAQLTLQTQSSADDARLPDPLYPDVIALWEGGQPGEALAALDRMNRATGGEAPLEALVLRARLLAAAGQHQPSAVAWEDIAARTDSIEPVAFRFAADGYVRSGNLSRAEELLGRRPIREFGDLWSALATAYRTAGEFERAASLYRRVVAGSASASASDLAALNLAATLEQAGDRPGALAVLRTLQLQSRQAANLGRARTQALKLADALDMPLEPFAEHEYRRIANRLRDASLFDDAIAVLEDWKRAYPASAAEVQALMADTFYRARANTEARAEADKFLEQYPTLPQASDVHVLQYRLDVREGRTDGVRARGRALWLGDIPGVPLEDRLSLGRLLAAYLVSVGELSEGLDVYDRLYRTATQRDLRIDVLWRAGVAAIRAGQLDRAERTFATMRRLKPGPDTSLIADYWTAVLALRRNRPKEAVASLTALARATPYTYYGIRAREQLVALKASAPTSSPRAAFPAPTIRDTTRAQLRFRGAMLLARAGLKAEAAQMIRQLGADVRNDQALALMGARALASVGEYRQAVGIMETRFGAFLETPASGVPDDFWRLAYPRAFWSIVRPAGESARVDPLLLLSLARQESRFDPSVRSVVGAIGLFQIMPYTADNLAPKVGVTITDRAMLLRPQTSAAFGARLTADLLSEFDNEAVPVMAAYNAGEGRAAEWWKAARGVSQDLFVDTIPYAETRTYVRTVYSNYVMYRQLYGSN
jgi:soluble lytic murein transglycosylase